MVGYRSATTHKATVLTVAAGRGGDHDAQVGRGAGARDDGGAEEPLRAGQLAARQPQHLEVAHLAGDAVPLAPPCAPHATAFGRGRRARGGPRAARARALSRAARPERQRRQRQFVRGRLHALHVHDGADERRGRARRRDGGRDGTRYD